MISSLDGSMAQVLLSLVGTNEEYSGSTGPQLVLVVHSGGSANLYL